MASLVKLSDIFTQTKEEHNFRQNRGFRIPSVNTMYHCSESTFYLGPKKWEIVPVKINEFNSQNSFKKEIKNWVPKNCPCRLRTQNISGVGFLPTLFFISNRQF